jgi:anti-sigma B factor antagonist
VEVRIPPAIERRTEAFFKHPKRGYVKISTRKVDGVMVVDISGRIVLGEGGSLREAVNAVLFGGEKKLLMNLAEVNYIDSTGLGELINTHTTVLKHGGQIQFVKLTNKVRDLLQITKLYTVLDIKDDEAEAIASLNSTIETAEAVVAV